MSKKICRTCLKMTYKTHKTHESIHYPGETEQLKISDMLRYLVPELYLGVTVNPEICEGCKKTLRVAYAFRKQCMATENVIGCYLKKSRCTAASIELIDVILFWEQKRKEARLNNQNDTKAKEIISEWDDDASQDSEQSNLSIKEKTQIPPKKEKELTLCPELGVFVDKFGNYYDADGLSVSDPEAIINTDSDFLKITEVFSLTDEGEPVPKILKREPAPKIHKGEPAPKKQKGEPAPKIQKGEPAPKIQKGEPAPKVHKGEPAPKILNTASTEEQSTGSDKDKNVFRIRVIPEAKNSFEEPCISVIPEAKTDLIEARRRKVIKARKKRIYPHITAVEEAKKRKAEVIPISKPPVSNTPEDSKQPVAPFLPIIVDVRSECESVELCSPLLSSKSQSEKAEVTTEEKTVVKEEPMEHDSHDDEDTLTGSETNSNFDSIQGIIDNVPEDTYVDVPEFVHISNFSLKDLDELRKKQKPKQDEAASVSTLSPSSGNVFVAKKLLKLLPKSESGTAQATTSAILNSGDVVMKDTSESLEQGSLKSALNSAEPNNSQADLAENVKSKSFVDIKSSARECTPSTSYASNEGGFSNEDELSFESNISLSDCIDELDTKECPVADSSVDNLKNITEQPLDVQPNANTNLTNMKEKKLPRERPIICPICVTDVSGHFTRHLFRHHGDCKDVRKLRNLMPGSKERSQLVASMRKEGYFLMKIKRDVVNPVKSSTKPEAEYFVCEFCLGQYSKKLLYRHVKICAKKPKDIKKPGKNCLSKSQTLMASMASSNQGCHSTSTRLKDEVFSIMRPDSISFVAKSDPLICYFGEMLLAKQTKRYMVRMVSNKMREMARLIISLKTLKTGVDNLFDALTPDMFHNLVSATRIISGFNVDTNSCRSPTIATNMGTNLRLVCDVACRIVVEGINIPGIKWKNGAQKKREIKELRNSILQYWRNDLSPNSTLLENLQETQWEPPMELPKIADIKSLHDYLNNCADEAFAKLADESDIHANYKILTECVLSLIVIYNRNRIDIVQHLKILEYTSNVLPTDHERLMESLTEVEKILTSKLRKVFISIRGYKMILLTKRIQKFIEYLIDVRNKHDIVPKSNPYLFAYPRSETKCMNGPYVIRLLTDRSGISYSGFLTSMKFRKHVATTLQLMIMDNDEMEKVAKFIGHTDIEFYRVPQDIYQAAKIAKILLLLEKGKGNNFLGRSLNEITFKKDVYYSSDSEFDDETENRSRKMDNIAPTQVAKKVKMPIGKGIQNRRRWTASDKNLVLTYFQKHIERKIAPKKRECQKLIALHRNTFSETDWIRVKALVYNTFKLNNP